MTKEEIIPFAEKRMVGDYQTRITFKNELFIVGRFENNGDRKFRDTNHWNFVRTPIIDEKNKFSVLNGEEFDYIDIIVMARL